VLIVGHFANTGEVEFSEVGCDSSIKVGLDFEDGSKDFVELALIRVSLINNVECRSCGTGWQTRGCMPARSAGVYDVQRVHLEASCPKNSVLKGASMKERHKMQNI
jgi:hypothetical protein